MAKRAVLFLSFSFPVVCLFVFITLAAVRGMEDLSSLSRD